MREALFPDNSTYGNGLITGGIAMHRARLVMARQALEVYLRHNGQMQLTRDGHKRAVVFVIEPLSGKTFTTPSGRLTKAGCRKALVECQRLLNEIDKDAIVYEDEA
jgi:hypothetical protein